MIARCGGGAAMEPRAGSPAGLIGNQMVSYCG